jgi:hypothetical protein
VRNGGGGLVGANQGAISQSFATGAVAQDGVSTGFGGIVLLQRAPAQDRDPSDWRSNRCDDLISLNRFRRIGPHPNQR